MRSTRSSENRYKYRIAAQVPLTQTGKVLVNFVEVWEYNKAGKLVYHNSWVTDFEVTHENAATVIGVGRSRWKIEHEQFNVQKNHGYELEHNYGHGHENLALVFYLLNLLAFLAHKVLELGDRRYQQCRVGESRRGLWGMLRAAFYLFTFASWDELLRNQLRAEARGPSRSNAQAGAKNRSGPSTERREVECLELQARTKPQFAAALQFTWREKPEKCPPTAFYRLRLGRSNSLLIPDRELLRD